MKPAQAVLHRLLRRAETARRNGNDEHVGQPMARLAEYTHLESLAEREAFHAAIALAEREGAIHVQRHPHIDDGKQLQRLTVADIHALARHLDVTLLDDRLAAARLVLQPWLQRFPVLEQVLVRWQADKKVRKHGVEAAQALADAARAVAAREADAGNERILRRESVRLFGDSKRLERLTPWLDLIINGELTATGLAKTETWSAIGLRREPQPMLLAGPGSVRLEAGTLPLLRPWLGLPTETVQAIDSTARAMLTIENLATFHDAVNAPHADALLLIYTGGMPSPAWRTAWARLLADFPADRPVYHWGDIDEGGYRIAAVLAETARQTGHRLQPCLMTPSSLPPEAKHRAGHPSASTRKAMQRFAKRAGWDAIAADLEHHAITLEQEALDPVLPQAAMDDLHGQFDHGNQTDDDDDAAQDRR